MILKSRKGVIETGVTAQIERDATERQTRYDRDNDRRVWYRLVTWQGHRLKMLWEYIELTIQLVFIKLG